MNSRQSKFIKNVIIGFIVIMIIFGISKCSRQKTIRVTGLPEQQVYFSDNHQELEVDQVSLEGSTRLKQKMEPGSYVLYYQEDESTRYYGTLHIKKKQNEAKIKFRKHKLPVISRQLVLNTNEDAELGSSLKHYGIYNEHDVEITYDADINISVRGKRNGKNNNFLLKWKLGINGNSVSDEEIEIERDEGGNRTIWEDKLHAYTMTYKVIGNTAELQLKAVFK
ncbi:MAG TPA: hypothetical protein PLD62_03140 [Candidatus Cloacimonadota bacterium]|nr:hypothetical protein [Candidatus Cloacimonadota bacterium]